MFLLASQIQGFQRAHFRCVVRLWRLLLPFVLCWIRLFREVILISERLLTVSEAAAALSLNPQTVRVWLRGGKLRGLRTRGDGRGRDEWRVPESAIIESLTPATQKTD